jgi:hypothetical protein
MLNELTKVPESANIGMSVSTEILSPINPSFVTVLSADSFKINKN